MRRPIAFAAAGVLAVSLIAALSMSALAANPEAPASRNQVYTGTSMADYTPVADWQVGSDGTVRDAVSGGEAAFSRASAKTRRNSAGTLSVVPTGTLSVEPWSMFRPSGHGYAAIIEESRTNQLIGSHGLPNNGSSWTNWPLGTYQLAGTLPSQSLVSGVMPGGTALRIQYTGAAADGVSGQLYPYQITPAGTFSAGDVVTYSTWMRGSSTATVRLTLEFRDAANAILATHRTAPITLGNTWERRSVTTTEAPTGTSRIRAYVWVSGLTGVGRNLDLSVDAMQAEKGGQETSYIPTVASPATRAADFLSIPTSGWDASSGSLVAIGQLAPGRPQQALVSAEHSASEMLRLRTSGLAVIGEAVSGGESYSSSQTAPAGVAVAGVTWASASPVYAYAAGTAGAASAGYVPTTLPATASLGHSLASGQYVNGPLHRVVSYDVRLSGSQMGRLGRLLSGLSDGGTSGVVGTTNSYALSWDYTEDSDNDAVATAYVREAGTAGYGGGTPMSRGSASFSSEATRLVPGTTYVSRMGVTDPDGVGGSVGTTESLTAETTFTVPTEPVYLGIPDIAAEPSGGTVFLPYGFDTDGDASADLLVSGDGGVTWTRHAMTRDPARKLFHARITGLVPGTQYEASFDVADDDGTAGVAPGDSFPFLAAESWQAVARATVTVNGVPQELPVANRYYWWKGAGENPVPIAMSFSGNNDALATVTGSQWSFRPGTWTDGRGEPVAWGGNADFLSSVPIGLPDAEGWYGPFPRSETLSLSLVRGGTYTYSMRMQVEGTYRGGAAFSESGVSEHSVTAISPNSSGRQ